MRPPTARPILSQIASCARGRWQIAGARATRRARARPPEFESSWVLTLVADPPVRVSFDARKYNLRIQTQAESHRDTASWETRATLTGDDLKEERILAEIAKVFTPAKRNASADDDETASTSPD